MALAEVEAGGGAYLGQLFGIFGSFQIWDFDPLCEGKPMYGRYSLSICWIKGTLYGTGMLLYQR